MAPVALLLEALLTLAVVSLGAEPRPATGSPDMYADVAQSWSLIEGRDRVVLLAWWLSVPVVLLLSVQLARFAELPAGRVVAPLVLLAAFGVAIAAALMRNNTVFGLDEWIADLAPHQLGLGLLAVVSVGAALAARRPLAGWVAAAITAAVGLAYLAPALMIRVPPGSAGEFHAGVVIDELLAPAAGRTPLVDYFPQYLTLLGLPIAPFARVWPEHALGIALGWIVMLQVATIAAAVILATVVGGRRTALVALVLLAGPLVFAMPNGVYTAAYPAALPFRTVLPVITILVAVALFGRGPSSRPGLRALALGMVAGTAALNNPDHGLPVVAAAGAGVLVVTTSWSGRLRATLFGAAGAAVPVALYTLVTWAMGETAHWSSVLLFPKVFAVVGFGNVAMPAFGTHAAIVAFFVSATVIGFVLVRRPDPRLRLQGFALFVTGCWSMLTLPYYTARSIAPQLLLGYAVQVGLVAVLLLPLLVRAVAAARAERRSIAVTASMGLTALALGAIVATLFSAPTPATSWDRVQSNTADPWQADTDLVTAQLAEPSNRRLDRLADQRALGQVMPVSSLQELRTGVVGVTIVNSPWQFEYLRSLLRLQCQELARTPVRAIIWPTQSAGRLKSVDACRANLQTRVTYPAFGPNFVIVDVR